MACWFFMSYARLDGEKNEENLVRTFYEHLEQAVASKVTHQSGTLAYLDQANLKPGDPWKIDIANALRECKTFIPIMTARYFTRLYCGKEWSIFESRCQAASGDGPPPRLIIPVLWVRPVEGEIPEFASDLQVTFDPMKFAVEDRPKLENLEQYGLEYVVDRRELNYKGIYKDILNLLSDHIIRTTGDNDLPPLLSHELPNLKQAPAKFGKQEETGATPSRSSNKASFAFVAGTREEIQHLRPDGCKFYGSTDPGDWIPFAPEDSDSIAWIAQTVATEKKLVVKQVPINDRIADTLRDAEKRHSVAIVVVDPWTSQLTKYAGILDGFDQFQFRNCVVIVAWSKNDQETMKQQAHLQNSVERALSRRFTPKNTPYFKNEIQEPTQLKKAIIQAVKDMEAVLAPNRDPARATGKSERNKNPSITAAGGDS